MQIKVLAVCVISTEPQDFNLKIQRGKKSHENSKSAALFTALLSGLNSNLTLTVTY